MTCKRLTIYLALVLCLLLALPAQAAADRFQLSVERKTLFAGETLSLTLDRGGRAAEGEADFTSSAPKVATVDASGVVTGVAPGQTTITARLNAKGRSFRSTLRLTVERQVTGLAMDQDNIRLLDAADPALQGLIPEGTAGQVFFLPVRKSVSLRPVVEPKNAGNRKVTITVSDESVATVRGNVLQAKQAGSTKLTITSVSNPAVSVSYTVVVSQPVSRVVVSAAEQTVFVGGSVQLTADVQPGDATLRAVIWKSMNEKLATVDASGRLTALAKGTVRIRATAADGSGRYGDTAVRILQAAESISLDQTNVMLPVPNRLTLRATILPANADNKRVTWTSSDEGIVTVNRYGSLTAMAAGTATITAASESNPEIRATATVRVVQPVKTITFEGKTATVRVGETIRLNWHVAPVDASVKDVTLTSGNPKVATVDADGTVHGLQRGATTITAVAVDGSRRRGSIRVNVEQPVTGVHFNNDSVRVGVNERLRIRAVIEPKNANNNHMSWSVADSDLLSIKGGTNRPILTGRAWGTTTVTGTTQDGGYTATLTVKVGNLDRALKIDDLYLRDNRIKIVVRNESNLNISRFDYKLTAWDEQGNPLDIRRGGGNSIEGSYEHSLAPGESTEHGRFTFRRFQQPSQTIGKITMAITAYATDTGAFRSIREDRRREVSFQLPTFREQPQNGSIGSKP